VEILTEAQTFKDVIWIVSAVLLVIAIGLYIDNDDTPRYG